MRTFCDQMCTDISTDKSHYNVICVRECVASIDPDDFCKSMCANESAASLVFGWSQLRAEIARLKDTHDQSKAGQIAALEQMVSRVRGELNT